MYEVVNCSGGEHHSAAVTKCGKLFTWGRNIDGRLLIPKEKYKARSVVKNQFFPKEAVICRNNRPVHMKQVSCGSNHTLAIDDDGFMYSGGNGDVGQLGISPAEQPSGIQMTKTYV